MSDTTCCIEERVRIALLGEFSAGKSTLFNSLSGSPLAATGAVPTTAEPATLLAPGRARGLPDGPRHKRVSALLSLGAGLIDTPGLNAEDPRHRERALAVASTADVVLFVVRASDITLRTSLSALQQLRRGSAVVAVVVSHVDPEDFEDEDDREDFDEELAESLGDGPRFLVDGRDLGALDGPRLRGWIEAQTIRVARHRLLSELRGAFHMCWLRLAHGDDFVPEPLRTDAVCAQLTAHRAWWGDRVAELDAEAEALRDDPEGLSSDWGLPAVAQEKAVAKVRPIRILGARTGELLAAVARSWDKAARLETLGCPLTTDATTTGALHLRAWPADEVVAAVQARRRPGSMRRGGDEHLVVLRSPRDELGAPWSALGLDASGFADASDWPRLMRIAAERLSGQPVFLVDPGDLSSHDGPRLLRSVQAAAAQHVRVALPAELGRQPDHWLRRWMAGNTAGWREALPPALRPRDPAPLDAEEARRDAAAAVWRGELERAAPLARQGYLEQLRGVVDLHRRGLQEQSKAHRRRLRRLRRQRATAAGWLLSLAAGAVMTAAGIGYAWVVGPGVGHLAGVQLDLLHLSVSSLAALCALALVANVAPWRWAWSLRRGLAEVHLVMWTLKAKVAWPRDAWAHYAESDATVRYNAAVGLPRPQPAPLPAPPKPPATLHPDRRGWAGRLTRGVQGAWWRRTSFVALVVLAWLGLVGRNRWGAPPAAPAATPQELLERGRAAIKAGELDVATAALGACLEAEPDLHDCRWELGWAHWKGKDFVAVVETWTPLEGQEAWAEAELERWLGEARKRVADAANAEGGSP